MKKFEDKVFRLESKAKRKLLQKQAREHDRQARKFRQDSLKLGAALHNAGVVVYRDMHPVYEELILPLLEEAGKTAAKYGFNVLFQVHTPMEKMSELTSCIGSINEKTATDTMKGCIDLINQRPVVSRKSGKMIAEETAGNAVIEVMAKAIYSQWEGQPGFQRWVEGGNSLNQEKARDLARASINHVSPIEKSDNSETQ